MADTDFYDIIRRSRVNGTQSVRVSMCSSGRVSSGTESISSVLQSVSTRHIDRELEFEQSNRNSSVIDTTDLVESTVDSEDDELLTESECMTIRDAEKEALEKNPADRTDADVSLLLDFTQHIRAFANMTLCIREALCKVMVFNAIKRSGTVIYEENQEPDSWIVIINGQIEIAEVDKESVCLNTGDSFGFFPDKPEEQSQTNRVIKTKTNDCQLLRVMRDDYTNIMNRGKESIRQHEVDGRVVLVTESRLHPNSPNKRFHVVIKGTVDQLINQMIRKANGDFTFDEDFLLTYRVVMDSPIPLCNKLMEWFENTSLRDKVTQIVILWINNHFIDFDTNSCMVDFLEKFDSLLEEAKMHGHMKLFHHAIATRAKVRTIILSRSSREESLPFSIMGGKGKGNGLFISHVEKGSKAENAGLKRADQIIGINGKNVSEITLKKGLEIFRSSTHLSITVQMNLKSFKGIIRAQDFPPKRTSKRYEQQTSLEGTPSNLTVDYGLAAKRKSGYGTVKRTKSHRSVRSSRLIDGPKVYFEKLWHIVYNPSHNKSNETENFDETCDSVKSSATIDRHKKKEGLRKSLTLSMSIPDLTKLDLLETPTIPQYVFKIYLADQSYKLLFTRKETKVQDVIFDALQEFEIEDTTATFCLCEVSATESGVKQRCLPNHLDNLDEKVGVGSRLYLRNTSSSEPLVPEEILGELTRESQVNFLSLKPIQLAIQLTLRDYAIFSQIEGVEFVNDLFQLKSNYGTPNLNQFSELSNWEMFWVMTEVCNEPSVFRRMKVIKRFIKIAQLCNHLKNFNSMFNIISGLSNNVVSRLKQTWEKLPVKHQRVFAQMQDLMNPSRNMSKYRSLINSAGLFPPVIPFFPVLKKDLTFIHLGNDTYIDELVNFEKLRMISKEIRNVLFMKSRPYEPNTMSECLDEIDICQQLSSVPQLAEGCSSSTHMERRRGFPDTFKLARKKSMNFIHTKKEILYEKAQLMRRARAYLKNVKIIPDEDYLCKLSKELEPPLIKTFNKSASSETFSKTCLEDGRKQRASPAPSTISETGSSNSSNVGLNPLRSCSPAVSEGWELFEKSNRDRPHPGICTPSKYSEPQSGPRSNYMHSHSDLLKLSETSLESNKLVTDRLAARRSTKTWSYVSTDSGVSNRSFSSQQPQTSSASSNSIDAETGFCTPLGYKSDGTNKVLHTRYSRHASNPLIGQTIGEVADSTHGWAASSPTIPTVVINQPDGSFYGTSTQPCVQRIMHEVQLLPPLQLRLPVLKKATSHSTSPNMQVMGAVPLQTTHSILVRRTQSEDDIK